MTPSDIYRFLDDLGVEYGKCEHPAVFTVEESSRLVPELPGTPTKNLFIRDGKGRRHFLIVVGHDKSVDLKSLGERLEAGKLSFASPQRLQKHLGLEPGSVSILGIVNDSEGNVELVIDRAVWESDAVQCHPLVNTATVIIPRAGLRRILEHTGHAPRVLDVPGR